MRRMMQWLHRPVYAARLAALTRLIATHLRANDRVLDVGCGFGALGRSLLDWPMCPNGVTIRGVERVKRGGEQIEVDQYHGDRLPYDDHSFDVVIVADVLHHESNPDHLISECVRVSRRLLIIKDHKVDGPFAQWRISLIDWAANAPYGVPCLYRYNTRRQWADSHARHGLKIEQELTAINLYPLFINLLFARRLQYFAVLNCNRTGPPSPVIP